MAFDVTVKIDLTKPVGTVGFGVPLILLENADKAVAYTEVSRISEMVDAGIVSTSAAYKAAQLLFAQNNAPKTIAVYAVTGAATDALADAKLVDKGWRQLIVVSDGDTGSEVADISSLVETMDGKMFFHSSSLVGNGTEHLNYRRTVLFYYPVTEDIPAPVAALVGESAGRDAGSFTYKNLILKGLKPLDLSDAEVEAAHEKGYITFIAKAGDYVTSEGKVAGGEYIDIIDSEDYIVQQLAYKTQKVLNSAAKVPYDNNGIAMLESVAKDVLQRAYNNGMIATNEDGTPAYWVDYALREDTEATDRAKRVYLGGNFGFTLAGAIHTVEITGSITV